mmetsp:Transcript_26870/g.83131  ORF Transcript_26870/g.83131 Transcript_26870/m.83131 type:complete len:371 (-) Transcript_26870:320-1432(-)
MMGSVTLGAITITLVVVIVVQTDPPPRKGHADDPSLHDGRVERDRDQQDDAVGGVLARAPRRHCVARDNSRGERAERAEGKSERNVLPGFDSHGAREPQPRVGRCDGGAFLFGRCGGFARTGGSIHSEVGARRRCWLWLLLVAVGSFWRRRDDAARHCAVVVVEKVVGDAEGCFREEGGFLEVAFLCGVLMAEFNTVDGGDGSAGDAHDAPEGRAARAAAVVEIVQVQRVESITGAGGNRPRPLVHFALEAERRGERRLRERRDERRQPAEQRGSARRRVDRPLWVSGDEGGARGGGDHQVYVQRRRVDRAAEVVARQHRARVGVHGAHGRPEVASTRVVFGRAVAQAAVASLAPGSPPDACGERDDERS